MVKRNQALSQNKKITMRSLYDGYACMLFGYISEVVKDRKIAEDYLVKVFSSIAKQFNKINWDETNTWCQLQRIAKCELTAFINAAKGYGTDTTANTPNKYLYRMSGEQQHIFCSFYYSGKTTAQLSTELNKPEKLIRKSLKEAFAVIKKTHDN